MTYYNINCIAHNLDEAFEYWYNTLSTNTNVEESRDGDVVGEVIGATTVILDPTRNIMKSKIRNLPMRYAIGELLWYLSGNNKLDAIRNYTSNWDRMSDDGETVNSNYGYCIQSKYGFDQLNFVVNKLKEDPKSRQAVIHIKEPNNNPSKDVNCTVCLQFFIREGKLYMITYMRSNDLWTGFTYDVFQFTCLQICLAMKLNLGIGTYTHIAGSLHLYERNYDCKIITKKMESQ